MYEIGQLSSYADAEFLSEISSGCLIYAINIRHRI